MEEELKIKNKNRPKQRYLKQNKNIEDLTVIKDLLTQYLSLESKNEIQSFLNGNNFIKIYNSLFLINDKQNLIELYSLINQKLVKLINIYKRLYL